jgi:hypothetical protein
MVWFAAHEQAFGRCEVDRTLLLLRTDPTGVTDFAAASDKARTFKEMIAGCGNPRAP